MKKMLEMLKNVEFNGQDNYLDRIKNDNIICFLPSLSIDMLVQDIDAVERLCARGLNINAICMFDEVVPLMTQFKVDFSIISASEIKNIENKGTHIVIVYSKYVWPNSLYRFFEKMGFDFYFIHAAEYLKGAKEYHWAHIIDLYNVYQGLNDDLSKKVFLSTIEGRMTGQIQNILYADEPQYMLQGFMPFKNCIAIDGGAFDGESARCFSELGAEVYSFELDKNNFKRVEEMSKKYNFYSINKGLWSCQKDEKYRIDGAGSTIDDAGNDIAELIDIDTFVRKNELPRVDYIKLDVEGAEIEALKGAMMSISKWKPILAISAYHRTDDLWEIYKYIKSIRIDYEFAFRYYKIDARDYYLDENARNIVKHYGLDLMIPTPWEYVLYAR